MSKASESLSNRELLAYHHALDGLVAPGRDGSQCPVCMEATRLSDVTAHASHADTRAVADQLAAILDSVTDWWTFNEPSVPGVEPPMEASLELECRNLTAQGALRLAGALQRAAFIMRGGSYQIARCEEPSCNVTGELRLAPGDLKPDRVWLRHSGDGAHSIHWEHQSKAGRCWPWRF